MKFISCLVATDELLIRCDSCFSENLACFLAKCATKTKRGGKTNGVSRDFKLQKVANVGDMPPLNCKSNTKGSPTGASTISVNVHSNISTPPASCSEGLFTGLARQTDADRKPPGNFISETSNSIDDVKRCVEVTPTQNGDLLTQCNSSVATSPSIGVGVSASPSIAAISLICYNSTSLNSANQIQAISVYC